MSCLTLFEENLFIGKYHITLIRTFKGSFLGIFLKRFIFIYCDVGTAAECFQISQLLKICRHFCVNNG